MKYLFVFLLMLVLAYQIRVVEKSKVDIVKLQLDREEIKLHTDQLAEVVKIQQYQIDVLAESTATTK